MSDDRSLLAHLVPKLTRGVEDAATDALAFILNESKLCRDALARTLAVDEHKLEAVAHVRTQVTVSDKSRLDLVAFDSAGDKRLIIESKFWAPLLDGQATRYVKELSPGGPAMLLFVAPQARHETLWVKIKRQFEDAPTLELGPDRDIGRLTVAEVIGSERTVALMSWDAMLNSLKHADSARDDDLRQLRGLAQAQDEVAFAPLHAEDLIATVPRRVMSFMNLIDGVVDKAKREDWLTTKGMRTAHHRNAYLRFVGFHREDSDEPIGLALCVDLDIWATTGTSPIWLRIWHKQPIDLDELNKRLATGGWLPCRREPDWLWVPIELPTGVEYDDVRDTATDQVKRVVDIARQLVN